MPAPEKAKVLGTPTVDYVVAQFRKFQVTEKQHCRAAGEMKHLAETYRTYLVAVRNYRKLHDVYSKGERSVEETAKMVGFKLPREYDPKAK